MEFASWYQLGVEPKPLRIYATKRRASGTYRTKTHIISHLSLNASTRGHDHTFILDRLAWTGRTIMKLTRFYDTTRNVERNVYWFNIEFLSSVVDRIRHVPTAVATFMSRENRTTKLEWEGQDWQANNRRSVTFKPSFVYEYNCDGIGITDRIMDVFVRPV